MNSWDCWDTLLARRTMRDELHWLQREGWTRERARTFELDNLIPIKENIDRVRPEDIIVSDYGDGTPFWLDFLKEAFAKFGLHNQIYLTPDGKWKRTIWPQIHPKPSMHFGDTQQPDVDSPRENGIAAELIVRSPFTPQEQMLVDAGFLPLARACREARLRTYNPKYRGIEMLQVNYNFPVLVMASVMLNRKFPTGTILMSSRDCFMWQKLMQQMYGRGVYWITSRILRGPMFDENYRRYTEQYPNPSIVDIAGEGGSLVALQRNLGYDIPCVLLFKPTTSPYPQIDALVHDRPIIRFEQGNFAPEFKAVKMNEKFEPEYVNMSKTDWPNEPTIAAQVNAFMICLDVLKRYDITCVMNAQDDKLRKTMFPLMDSYVNFIQDLADVTNRAIADDADPPGIPKYVPPRP